MTESQLKAMGFRRKWLSDKSGYWMQYNLKSNLLTNGQITVEDGKYILWCEDVDNGLHCYLKKDEATEASLTKQISQLEGV